MAISFPPSDRPLVSFGPWDLADQEAERQVRKHTERQARDQAEQQWKEAKEKPEAGAETIEINGRRFSREEFERLRGFFKDYEGVPPPIKLREEL